MRSQLGELETLDLLWAKHRIRLHGPYGNPPDVFYKMDHGAGVESVWNGEEWARWEPKRYPSVQAAFADLPTILRKTGILL